MISLLDRVENIVGKGENAGYQYFLLFPQCFQKASSSCRVIKSWDCVGKGYDHWKEALEKGGKKIGRPAFFSPFPKMFSIVLETNLLI